MMEEHNNNLEGHKENLEPPSPPPFDLALSTSIKLTQKYYGVNLKINLPLLSALPLRHVKLAQIICLHNCRTKGDIKIKPLCEKI